MNIVIARPADSEQQCSAGCRPQSLLRLNELELSYSDPDWQGYDPYNRTPPVQMRLHED